MIPHKYPNSSIVKFINLPVNVAPVQQPSVDQANQAGMSNPLQVLSSILESGSDSSSGIPQVGNRADQEVV